MCFPERHPDIKARRRRSISSQVGFLPHHLSHGQVVQVHVGGQNVTELGKSKRSIFT